MNILLDDDIAAKSSSLVPEAKTLPWTGRRIVGVHGPGRRVACHCADQVTDVTLVYLVQSLDVEIIGPGLEVAQVDEFPGYGLLPGFADDHAAGDVNGHGLGEIKMLACINRGGSLFGVEVGRGLDHHGIQQLIKQSLV